MIDAPLPGGDQMVTKVGNDAANSLTGTSGADLLDGRGGNDILKGLGGNDILYGGDGNDNLQGGSGDDILQGGNGNDTFDGGFGDENFLGGEAGNDTFLVNVDVGSGVISGGSGFDTISFANSTGPVVMEESIAGGYDFGSIEKIIGSAFSDVLVGSIKNDTLLGGDGNDNLTGGDGNDLLDGQRGNDTLSGDGGNDRLYGRGGNDTLSGGDGNDTLDGGNGTNLLDGGAGNDTFLFTQGIATIDGGTGTDTLSFAKATSAVELDDQLIFHLANGGGGSIEGGIEKVIGSPYNDVISPVGGTWSLYGGAGNDYLSASGKLFGQGGNDTLAPGANTTVYGGSGHDTFFISFDNTQGGIIPYADGAIIRDFTDQDVIQLFGPDPDAFLSNDGDLWTVHSTVDHEPLETTFQISGVTQLQAGEDYVFV
jgi:Ca2+-binding RTX toxin-like protein